MNKFISRASCFLMATITLSACVTTQNAKSNPGKWQTLFDGKNLDQWRGFRIDSVPSAWQIEGDAFALTKKGGGYLITRQQFSDFELVLDWKIVEGGNSGILFHVSESPEFKSAYESGPEMQILDDERHPDATKGKPGTRKAGANYDLIALSTPAVKPAGQWNSIRLIVNKGHVEHWLNGKKVVEYTLWSPEWEALVKGSKFATLPKYGRFPSGYICLQDHGDKVWFKNVKVRTL